MCEQTGLDAFSRARHHALFLPGCVLQTCLRLAGDGRYSPELARRLIDALQPDKVPPQHYFDRSSAIQPDAHGVNSKVEYVHHKRRLQQTIFSVGLSYLHMTPVCREERNILHGKIYWRSFLPLTFLFVWHIYSTPLLRSGSAEALGDFAKRRSIQLITAAYYHLKGGL